MLHLFFKFDKGDGKRQCVFYQRSAAIAWKRHIFYPTGRIRPVGVAVVLFEYLCTNMYIRDNTEVEVPLCHELV